MVAFLIQDFHIFVTLFFSSFQYSFMDSTEVGNITLTYGANSLTILSLTSEFWQTDRQTNAQTYTHNALSLHNFIKTRRKWNKYYSIIFVGKHNCERIFFLWHEDIRADIMNFNHVYNTLNLIEIHNVVAVIVRLPIILPVLPPLSLPPFPIPIPTLHGLLYHEYWAYNVG